MLLTALEIIAFIVAAAIIGTALGWVLRGALGREQTEISDLRAQLRQMKKANREIKAEKASIAATSTVAEVAKPAADTPAKKTVAKKAPAKKASAKAVQTEAKKKVSAKSGKKGSARKTQAEREADQVAGKKAFAEVVSRVGKVDAKDRLSKILGIGKKYEEMLNELDISSYEQISKLRKADVRTLAAALGVLDDRLETEDWVGSAKKLLKEAKK